MNEDIEQRLLAIAERENYDSAQKNALRLGAEEALRWLPISSAPRDGSGFLAYEYGYGIQNCWWDEGHDYGGGFRNPHHGWSSTHWMPLPPPPKGAEQ